MVCCFHGSQDPISNGTNANAIGRNGGLENCICYDNQTYARNPQDTGNICGTLEAHMGTGGNTVPLIQNAVAIAENVIGRKVENGGNGIGAQNELAYTQNATGVMGVMSINCQGGSGIDIQQEVTETVTAASNSSGNNKFGVCDQKTVRRLLPICCERLMGFPDNHTRIAWNGKNAEECPDAPRYKACGNSFCCNVVEWIGRRIDMFDEPRRNK